MARWASVEPTYRSAVLNAGQATIFNIGLAICHGDVRLRHQDSHNTVGDFVMINAMMIQLYQP